MESGTTEIVILAVILSRLLVPLYERCRPEYVARYPQEEAAATA